MNENKVPCGGFRIGDGLTMDSNTLKSLGEAYVKVISNDDETFEFMDDSPLKTYGEIASKSNEAKINLMVYSTLPLGNNGFETVLDDVFVLKADNEDGLCFHDYFIDTKMNRLFVTVIIIARNNQITQKRFAYTLTPAT